MTKFSDSKYSAWLQRIVSYRREASGLYREIASRLPLENAHRVLDIGTGTGLQLRAVHDCNSRAELFGLDLSAPAIELAQKALAGLPVDLRVGSIARTDYRSDFFDIITCNSSLSYWDEPRECLDEIYRILKPGGQAVLFEPHRDIDIPGALDRIRENMADRNPLLRWAAVRMNAFALTRGARIGLKLYSIDEFEELIRKSRFGDHGAAEETSLLGIPIFACLKLWKPTGKDPVAEEE